MIIYRCDKCGKEHHATGVVSNANKTHGFEQLAISLPGITDVCAGCFKEVAKAWRDAESEAHQEKKRRFMRLLGWGK